MLEAVTAYWRRVDDAVCLLEARDATIWRPTPGGPAVLQDVDVAGTRFLDLPGEATFTMHGMGLTVGFADGYSVAFDVPRDATVSSDLWKIRTFSEQIGIVWPGFEVLRAACVAFSLESPVQQVSERGVFEVSVTLLHRWHSESVEGEL